MNILILSAMEEEIEYLVSSFNLSSIDTINKQKLYTISNNDNTIYILNSGIGKVNATITTNSVLNSYQIDRIISIGTAGALSNASDIGQFVNGLKLAYHDVDVTAFGYNYGQVPHLDTYFDTTNDKYWHQILTTLKQNQVVINDGTIVSGDQFINDSAVKMEIMKKFDQPLCVEMESTAIVHTAKTANIKCNVLRSISDKAEGEANVDFDTYLQQVCKKYKLLVDIVLAYE